MPTKLSQWEQNYILIEFNIFPRKKINSERGKTRSRIEILISLLDFFKREAREWTKTWNEAILVLIESN